MTAPRRRLLVATSSAHKLKELQRLFGGLPIDLETLHDRGITDEAPEDGATFEENALQKARWYSKVTGAWTLADDSGLEVAALHGAPGVYTRRYAGANATDVENYEKLLAEMAGVADRSARFVCTMALIDPERASERIFRGECAGTLTEAPRGAFGFGYDPIFEVDGRTMAERAPDEKDALSHRGRAAALVAAALRSELEQTR